MSIENVKIAKVSLFIRERPPTAGPGQHLLPTSPISITHPKSFPPTTPKKRKHQHDTSNNKRQQKPITTIFNEYKSIKITNPKTFQSPRHEQKEFSFDKIFPHNTTQNTMFETVAQPIVEHMLNGYNACCFAYGQTGSGKTYSIFGENGIRRGLLPRSLDYMFQNLKPHQPIMSRKCVKQLLTKKKQSKSQLSIQTAEWSDNSNIMPTFFNISKASQFADPEDKYCIVVSFLEIYLDKIRDLGLSYLNHKGYKKSKSMTASQVIPPMNSPRNYTPHPFDGMQKLEIREDVNGQIFVKGLHHIPIESAKQALEVMDFGRKSAQQHSTLMNDVSSRSHTIFTVSILQKTYSYTNEMENGSISSGDSEYNETETWSFDITDTDSHLPYGYELYGRMHFVDLAGSERLDRSGSEGIRMLEAVNINKSLTALGKVIISLSNPDEYSHVPYRDSKLTRILQNSLSGNCYTTLLATINPYKLNYEETLQTLLFAHRCTNIKTRVHSNYLDHRDKIVKLQKRIQLLLKELGGLRSEYQRSDLSAGEVKKLLFEKQPELHGDLNGLVDAATSLLTGDVSRGKSMSFESNHSSQNYKNLMNQLSFGGGGGVNEQFLRDIDFDRIHDLEREIESLERANESLHDKIQKQSEAYNSQTTEQKERIKSLTEMIESKNQSIKNIEADKTEKLQTQRTSLIQANQNAIKSMLLTLLRTPTYSLRGTIRQLINEYKLNEQKEFLDAFKKMEENKNIYQDDEWTMTAGNEVVPSGYSHIPRKQFDKLCRKMEIKQKQQIKKMQNKFNETLNYKTQRITQLKKEMERMHNEYEQQHKQLQDEFSYLYKCLGNLTGIIESVEQGKFTVHITSGIRKIQVPKTTDTESSEDTLQRCETLRHLLHRSDSFIDRQLKSDQNALFNDENEQLTSIIIDHNHVANIEEEISEVASIDDNIETIDSLNDDSPSILSPLQSERKDPGKYYQKQASQTRNALNSLRIAFESQKRQLHNQDERIKSLMISRSNSLSQGGMNHSQSFYDRHRDRSLSSLYNHSQSARSLSQRSFSHRSLNKKQRPLSAKSYRKKSRPNSAKLPSSRRPVSAHRPSSAVSQYSNRSEKVRLPFNKLSTNRILTRFGINQQ